MMLSEFKAWFEGYTENIKDQPSKKQWERIQARVAEIKAEGGTIQIIREYERRPWWPTWYTSSQPYWLSTSFGNTNWKDGEVLFGVNDPKTSFTLDCHNSAKEIGRLEAKGAA